MYPINVSEDSQLEFNKNASKASKLNVIIEIHCRTNIKLL